MGLGKIPGKNYLAMVLGASFEFAFVCAGTDCITHFVLCIIVSPKLLGMNL